MAIDKEWLVRKAQQAAPFEACGFIMEDGDIIEIANVSLAPMRAFKMDRDEMFEKLCDRVDFIQGIWHTHPGGSCHPSETDLDGITLGAIARHWDYYIVTATDVHMYSAEHYAPKEHSYWSRFGR